MVGGVMHSLSQRARDDLARILPLVPVKDFERTVGWYKLYSEHQESTPAQAQKALDALAKQAFALSTKLLEIRMDESTWNYLLDECQAFGDMDMANRVRHDLPRLSKLAEHAGRGAVSDVGKGRAISHRTRLIFRLASIIGNAGMMVNAKPNGALVRAFSIAMRELGEDVADHKRTVGKALDILNGKQ